jgi:hypothetical protein
VDVFSVLSLILQLLSNVKVAKLSGFDQLRANLISESSEITEVDSLNRPLPYPTVLHLLSKIFARSLKDNGELGFGFERLVTFIGAWLRL